MYSYCKAISSIPGNSTFKKQKLNHDECDSGPTKAKERKNELLRYVNHVFAQLWKGLAKFIGFIFALYAKMATKVLAINMDNCGRNLVLIFSTLRMALEPSYADAS